MNIRPSTFCRKCPRGFTLVELVVVIVITGILAAVMGAFFKPAIDSYFDSRRRAELTDVADSALRRMARDIRSGVPNSIRIPGGCTGFEVIPASAGGRFRLASDPGSILSAPIDGTTTVSSFDVFALSPALPLPLVGDWVVIDNQNTDDVYTNPNTINRSAIQSIATLTGATSPTSAIASHRITLAAFGFPPGYRGGRFSIVPKSQNAVFYLCSGWGGTAGTGDGTGTLYRFSNYDFIPLACPTPNASTPVVATNVLTCPFGYTPNDGATQNGFMWMQLQLQQAGELVTLSYGTHVDNVP